MGEYVAVIFGVSLAAAVVRMLAPEGSVKKYIQMLCSLCVVCALALPVTSFAQRLKNGEFSFDEIDIKLDMDSQSYEEIYNQSLLQISISDAEKALSEELCKKFSVSDGALSVLLECESTEDGIRIVGVSVLIGKKGITVSPDDITKYVAERLDTDCRIVYVS